MFSRADPVRPDLALVCVPPQRRAAHPEDLGRLRDRQHSIEFPVEQSVLEVLSIPVRASTSLPNKPTNAIMVSFYKIL